MELVEVSPLRDVTEITVLLGGRAIVDVLAALVEAGKLGRPATAQGQEPRADDVVETVAEPPPGG